MMCKCLNQISRFLIKSRPFNHYLALSLFFYALATIFLYVFSGATSPRSAITGGDSGIFLVMGDYLLNGDGVLFRDLFDNKGPYLFFIEALGLWLSPQYGVFILEALNLAVFLLLLKLIGDQLRARTRTQIVALGVVLVGYAFTGIGNTVEGWSLCFVTLPMYLTFRWIVSGSKTFPKSYTFVFGLCAGIVAFMRINNLALEAGAVLGICFMLAPWGKWRDILINGSFLILGFVIASLPAVIYFYVNGALYDMLYATFLYNLKYRNVWLIEGHRNLVVNGIRMIVCLFVSLLALNYQQRTNLKVFPVTVCMSVVFFLTFWDGAMYLHYFAMILPLFFLLMVFQWHERIWVNVAIVAIIFLPVFLNDWYFQSSMASYLHLSKFESTKPANVILKDEFRIVPASDYDSIYQLSLPLQYHDFLRHLGKRPVGKYFTQQDLVSQVDAYVENDIVERFREASPKWIISAYDSLHKTPLYAFAAAYEVADSSLIREGETIYLFRRIYGQ